ncbi:transposase [Thiospirochaeta perfilievii]|uniref:Transposase n=1 Tax=Thiospirochaeta perfilievii TaxID=252967 RepID=A0A5C1QBV5_9SPIO|nr:transposase [Thiospirochaeta perfilievii]QEN04560.1 transposase [Thiospirochaeta perfilievii]
MGATIKEIFTLYAWEYLMINEGKVPTNHKKVIDAIINCRTDVYGITFYKCEGCGEIHTSFRSCGNRHCPTCQDHKTKLWNAKQLSKELATNYFMITFTVPEEIRDFFLQNQKEAYSALFKASSDSIKESTQKSRTMSGATTGFFGVLHTWGRQIQYHPHIHYVVPGGALNIKKQSWISSSKDFFLPIFQLSKLCKDRFKTLMKNKGLLHQIPHVVWERGWNVNIQSVGSGRNTIKYLSRYVFKVAISDYRILKVQNRRVYFKFRSKKTGQVVTTSLEVLDFIKRYLLHVLPSGFMKIRYFGFMHTSFNMEYKDIRLIIDGLVAVLNKPVKPIIQKVFISCSACGKEMKFMFSILPNNIRIRGSSG